MSRIYRDYKKNPGNFWENLVQFSSSVMFDSLWPHGLQHARLLCPSPTPRVCSNSCPLSQWCHPTISPSVVHFSCLQSFPASGSFPMSQFFAIRWPKYWSFSFSPSNEYSGLVSFQIDWFDLPAVQGTLRSLLQHYDLKASILRHSAFFMVQLSHPLHDYWKTIALTIWTFVSKPLARDVLLALSVPYSKVWSWEAETASRFEVWWAGKHKDFVLQVGVMWVLCHLGKII